ncbi:amidoligase family protein [Streptacidiphilus jiangxiensis]|uniref:Putative amidoligase enzyme n=1 Tax=Streptacidiphilus jiangxiensis TaxID=235985 RepID=A0A1H8ANW2_STRJI|nr:amidoligase family protein [Streptacidiphilus jiangxiensis]SEM72430.1 Putative amidoligase enzyme [Streptacidiphilus jiangxiensis]
MGSGSRINHQHHLVAPTAGRTLTVPEGTEGITLDEAHQDLLGRVIRLGGAVQSGQATPEEQQRFADLRDEMRTAYGTEPGDEAPGTATGVASGGTAQPAAGAALPQEWGAPEDRAVQRAAAQQVLDETLAEHQAAAALQVQARDRWPADQDVSYEENFDAFRQAYQAARDRAARGEEAVPFLTENATGGLGSREGGRGFGLEIEFDVPDADYNDRREAIGRIARDLHEAGLSQDAYQHGYHSQAQAGYTDAANAWRLEQDCTVAGELVSPILYDEPDSWRNLATACQIIREHGGRATVGTGGHVHVGMHDFDHEVGNHNRLLQTYQTYEDVLYRLAQNPGSPNNRHRGTNWCRPNRVPAAGYSQVRDAAGANYHGMAVNLSAARGSRSDHGEFRLWDGSLNPGVIQAQTNLSLGMVAAAVRQNPAGPAHSSLMPLGSHRAQLREAGLNGRRLSGDAWRSSTLNFRRLVDEVFHRALDKEQATSLFAATRWQQR